MSTRLGVVAAAVTLAFGSVPPTAADQVDATYMLGWRGLEVGTFEVRLTRDPGRYRVHYEARSTGFLGRLFPFTSIGLAEGAVAGRRLVPERYEGQSRRRSGTSRWAVAFAPDGAATSVEVTGEDGDEREPVPAARQRGPDPLTQALRALLEAAPGGSIEGVTFDGKRATETGLACAGVPLVEEVPALGPQPVTALACELRGVVVAGASRRWRAPPPDDGPSEPGRLWLGRDLVDGASWPVRAELRSGFGRVTARLTALESRPGK